MSKMMSDIRTRCLANSVQTTILSSGVALFFLGTLVILLGFDVQAGPAEATSPGMPAVSAPGSQPAARVQGATGDAADSVGGSAAQGAQDAEQAGAARPAVGVHALIGALLAQNEARSHGPAAAAVDPDVTSPAYDQTSTQ